MTLLDKKNQFSLSEKDLQMGVFKAEIEEWKTKMNEQAGHLNKKIQQMKELESDLEKERKARRDCEKQLKDAKKQFEDANLILKTGEVSQDELRRRMTD